MTFVPRRIAWIVYGALEQVSGGYIYDRLEIGSQCFPQRLGWTCWNWGELSR